MTFQMTFQSEVIDVSHKGLGVVRRADGKNFFVPGVWPGDIGEFEVTKEEKKFGFAQLRKLVQSSPDRKAVECPHFGFAPGQCGGCPWLMARYEAQLSMKQKVLETQLKFSRLSLDPLLIAPIVGAEITLGYRTRAQLKTDGQSLGYVTPQSKDLAPIQDCVILSEHNRGLLRYMQDHLADFTRQLKNNFKFQFFDLDDDLSPEEIKVNVRRPFRQGHEGQNQRMKQILHDLLTEHGTEGPILELFCGAGNFTEVLAANAAAPILALENNVQAIAELKSREFINVDAQVADLFSKKTLSVYRSQLRDFRILVLDPPREGFEALPLWVKAMPHLQEIIYISCDLQTFIRDAEALSAGGWQIQQLTPVDLYPQTPHLEIISRFVRR